MSESDFIRGRVFGIKGNIRKGIVVKKGTRYVTWRWTSSEPGEGTIDSINDLMHWITWLGGIELEHLTEAEGYIITCEWWNDNIKKISCSNEE